VDDGDQRQGGGGRRLLHLRAELLLALLPTATVLGVFGLIEAFGGQRLLFASLASSAFLVYRDPEHQMNTVRSLLAAHAAAVAAGLLGAAALGPGYAAASAAMTATIVAMVLLDAVHPPAVSTALGFAFRPESAGTVGLFALAVGLVAALVALQRAALWLLRRSSAG